MSSSEEENKSSAAEASEPTPKSLPLLKKHPQKKNLLSLKNLLRKNIQVVPPKLKLDALKSVFLV